MHRSGCSERGGLFLTANQDETCKQSSPSGGPLAGLRVLEFLSIGPGPHCAMLLSDLGAEVVRIQRPAGNGWPNPIVDRGRQTITIDFRTTDGRDACIEAAEKADVLIEGFRPGVMERRGLGPEVLMARNPRLIYGRLTGWGQQGVLSRAAGHDINYTALTGALAAMGRPSEPPRPPLNLVGDFGGGSLFLAFGILAALWERSKSGRGQIVDAAIVDGVLSLMSTLIGVAATGSLSLERERSLLGGAAPFYRCYECKDGRHISVGAIEPRFYAELLELCEAPAALFAAQYDERRWPELNEALEKIFATRTRNEWCSLLEGTDSCFAPVLVAGEVSRHEHLRSRGAFVKIGDIEHQLPAPRFSRTPGSIAQNGDGKDALERWGVSLKNLS
jgi:alpha-methylacyl-CoA racemase